MKTINKYIALTLFLVTTMGLTVNSYSQSVEESAADNLPLPSDLFANHIEAVGGEESIRAHTMRTANGSLIINAYGINGELHMVAEAPNKLATNIELGQFGTSRSGYNGTIGWSMDPMSGNSVLQGEALKGMIKSADFYSDNLHLGNDAVKMETVETVTFDDGEHFRVLLVNTNGNESYLYFSKETGLLSGTDTMTLGASGMVPTQIRLGNYVEYEGVKSARRISSTQSGVETIIEIDSVSYDAVPENAFELPAEIQALVSE
jgi:hypothetical protein